MTTSVNVSVIGICIHVFNLLISLVENQLMSPDMKKENKENVGRIKRQSFGVDFTKMQKGAQPGGIGTLIDAIILRYL